MTLTTVRTDDPTTRARHPGGGLLIAGALAGPVFITASLVQAFTRDGFDLQRNAFSQLALGRWGFVQTIVFLLTGLLLLAGARGLQQASQPGQRWAPRLLAGYGAGMLLAGIFRTDPGYGYPAGAPQGPAAFTVHGTLHSLGFMIAMLSFIGFCVAITRRTAGLGPAVLVLAAAVAATPAAGTVSVRIALVAGIEFALITVVCLRTAVRSR